MAFLQSRKVNAETILVGVVGVTGSGKSSFIKRVTGRKDIIAVNGSDSVTEDIAQYSFEYKGKNFTLVDTPGFDDSDRLDEDIFRDLAKWTEKSYRAGQRLNGLIYLHPINVNRTRGSEARNLRMFKKLCGEDNFANVILGLTYCDQEQDQEIARRVQELTDTSNWWGDMIAQGSRVELISLDHIDCRNLVFGLAQKDKVTLKIQSELVYDGLKLDQTEAAQTIVHKQELDEIRTKERIELAEMKSEYRIRMRKASEAYDKEMASMKRRYELRRQEQEKEAQLLQERIRLNEELEHKERLRRDEERAEEEAQAAELQQMEENNRQTRLENDRLEHIKDLQTLCYNRYVGFEQDEWTTVEAWKHYGLVKQGFKYMNGQYEIFVRQYAISFCARCLNNLAPNGTFHTCADCPRDRNFGQERLGAPGTNAERAFEHFCTPCKESGKGCFKLAHHNFKNHNNIEIPSLKNCTRLGKDWEGTTCNHCSATVGPLFVHCCSCDDQFDLCVPCWGKGGTCRNTTHDLNVIAKCPPELKKLVPH